MKKFLSVTFAVALMAAISFGQAAGPRNGAPGGVQGGRQGQPGQGGGRMMMGGRMSKMQDEILAQLKPALTKDQKTKIEALRKKQAAEFEKMRGQMGAPGARGGAQGGATGGAKGGAKGGTTNGAGQRGAPPAGGSDMREKFRTMMEKNQKDFMAILTKPQQTQYEKLMKEAMEKMRKERGGAPGAGGKAGGATGGSKTGGGKGGGR